MDPFFTHIEPAVATRMAGLSRQMFELRERRKRLLERLEYEDDDALLAAIREGRVPAHPAYEAWLALGLMQERQQTSREQLDWYCRHAGNSEAAAPSEPVPDLPGTLPAAFRAQAPELHPDGIGFRSEDGLAVLARVLTPRDWSFEWRRGTALWRLDTAPFPDPDVPGRIRLYGPDETVSASGIGADARDRGGLILEVLQALADGRLPSSSE